MSNDTEKYLKRIEGLLVLLVQKLGATSSEIGAVMDLDPGSVRKKYPGGDVSTAEVNTKQNED